MCCQACRPTLQDQTVGTVLQPIAVSVEASALLQGFGTVGSWLAELLALRGCKILAVSDRNGAVFNAGGLDIRALRRHVKAKPPFGGNLLSYPGGELVDRCSAERAGCALCLGHVLSVCWL